ncbi:hypothetical protein KAI56_00090 [Candidatus Parcubacteria bacterium]|nr:hypothetical protein [Candidatus Parcubacteria bacterium]
MPGNKEDEKEIIRIIREFEVALKHQNKSDEQIEKDYYEAFEKLDDYARISIIKLLMHHRPDLSYEIFREITKSHIEKDIE